MNQPRSRSVALFSPFNLFMTSLLNTNPKGHFCFHRPLGNWVNTRHVEPVGHMTSRDAPAICVRTPTRRARRELGSHEPQAKPG